jgi:indolepyruvate ferredoxin oxidoreductase
VHPGVATGIAADEFTLGDRYRVEEGTVLVSGIQALVRVPLDRHRIDARAGLRTATFISGYQGSPLGTYDLALARERALLSEHDVHHTPGVNEELAATAVWGSQQEGLGPLPHHDGVVGIWYGKAPGVDRCGDVFRHGNLMGAHPGGGVLVLAGDDPTSKSSTMPSASEVALSDAQLPVLYPGNMQEILDLAVHAIALSRFSGLWVAMKIVTDIADGFGSATVSPYRITPELPPVDVDGEPWTYRQGGLALPPRNLLDERDLAYGRLAAARAYARANDLDEITHRGGRHARLGIVAAGEPYRDVVQALQQLGIDRAATDRIGLRILKLGMIWPIERDALRAFADGLDEIIVIEEKRPFIEQQVRDALYDLTVRPRVVGKHDERGARLVPADGELTADRIAPLLAARLGDSITGARAGTPVVLQPTPGSGDAAIVRRTPFFCSGCPHNRSTNVPDGSVAGGGIGCHTMAATMGRSSIALTQMGGEGAEWIGRAPFTDRHHMFQNMGDGTFFHSGSSAVRACVAAGVDITFKLLYNRAVAMTGGQDAAGSHAVPELTRLLDAEGVRRIIVCAEDPSQYPRNARWAPHVDVWSRDRLDEAQRLLRAERGVTVLVYDQACAAEKRRHRKRGEWPTPSQRVFINELVCEGCGDCSTKSNCLSVQPVDTELGRKRRIHQSSCNFDFTCLDGDCPSFVTLHETRRSRRRRDARRGAAAPRALVPLDPSDLVDPEVRQVDDTFALHLTGIGGTGVVTMSQVLATAAILDGFHVAGLDQTGLSQKGGPVVSHVKIATSPVTTASPIGAGGADAYLGFDLLVAAEPRNTMAVGAGTRAVVSTSAVPTGSMLHDRDAAYPAVDGLLRAVGARAAEGVVHLDAQALAETLFGDHMMANPLLLGAAYQAGAIPVSAGAIEHALELNGVAVERNRQAFRWGRRFVLDPDTTAAAAAEAHARAVGSADVPPAHSGGPAVPPRAHTRAEGLLEPVADELAPAVRGIVASRLADLVDYQNTRVAARYLDTVVRVASRERAAAQGRTELSEAVAHHLYTLTAYKDEYEVARLYLRPEFRAAMRDQFPDGEKARYRLHPPVLRTLGMRRKVALGSWFTPAFWLLRSARRVRGTPLDPFGATKVRRSERSVLREYRELVERAADQIDQLGYDRAVEVAELASHVRGYEAIKLAGIETFRTEAARLAPALPA